ncbi:Lethal(2)neighbour of Tid protein [Cordyceps militaris CM01]|uniref:Dol-P-Man:Man(5)GlcNAc(2)-PP-Dol alpha-1,3-mannosyltransferase n=1 Tax=Cordyceps militaris (strain CM01) TaxID=983644 RepID=G3J6N9_CORMM|nr:Lethal(2)neighbour of Tid protein [Cordyceps militaris CM01]EGX95367.1 Lethal(2)neighbour of Tid protein [Cordyceps militaris CM01]
MEATNSPARAAREPAVHVRALTFVVDVACGRHALSPLIPVALWLADAVLTCLIIWKIPYTEIDWVAYMEQITQFVHGERDYTKIKGGTGPLVYPAAHVYTYTGLYYLTGEGENVLLAQQLFAVLYMVTLGLVMLCYWKAKVPPYIFPLLILSKRLHSVFVLRCFNDCFAVFFLWLAIYSFQRRLWALGSMAYTWGLGIKMSLLLVLPAVGAVLLHACGFSGALSLAWLMAQVQIVIALPFIATNTNGYLARAFELSRQFQFEWTVNWRMLGEATFRRREWALLLLGLHAATLALFLATRWMRPAGKTLRRMVPAWLRGRAALTPDEEIRVSRRVTPDFVLTTMLSANLVGLLFARSLHYQFYAYLAWSTPFLLWRALPGGAAVLTYPLWLLQEWAWNVFPSTSESSTAAVAVMATTVLVVYFGTRNDGLTIKKPAAKKQ